MSVDQTEKTYHGFGRASTYLCLTTPPHGGAMPSNRYDLEAWVREGQHSFDTSIGNFYTVIGIAAKTGIPAERLMSWASAGYMPHHFIAGIGPLFKLKESVDWIRDNQVETYDGMPLPRTLPIMMPVGPLDNIPPELVRIPNLQRLMMTGGGPGVYFLTLDSKVVYVGQSVSVMSRVGNHLRERQKRFDLGGVFFIPCPEEYLLAVEKQFIDALQPLYNKGKWRGALL